MGARLPRTGAVPVPAPDMPDDLDEPGTWHRRYSNILDALASSAVALASERSRADRLEQDLERLRAVISLLIPEADECPWCPLLEPCVCEQGWTMTDEAASQVLGLLVSVEENPE